MILDSLPSRPTLLYIENDPNDQLLFIHAVAAAKVDFSVQAFADFKSAKDYISGHGPFQDRATYPFPVLVLLDYDLNCWCGAELVKWIRENPLWSHLTIVMFSDSGLGGRFSDCYKYGADHCVEKPMSMSGMKEVILCLHRCVTAKPMTFAELDTFPYYFANSSPNRHNPIYHAA